MMTPRMHTTTTAAPDVNTNNNNNKDNAAALILTSPNNHHNYTTTAKEDARWTTAARIACVCAILPLALLSRTEQSMLNAAYLHLVTTPVTGYILQRYHQNRYSFGPSCILVSVCLLMSNIAAVWLLWPLSSIISPPPNSNFSSSLASETGSSGSGHHSKPHILLATALTLGCIQLLWVCEKRVVFRVMTCTSVAMLVIALSIIAAFSSPHIARRFFQSATLPFLLLFMETTRPNSASSSSKYHHHSSSSKYESDHHQHNNNNDTTTTTSSSFLESDSGSMMVSC